MAHCLATPGDKAAMCAVSPGSGEEHTIAQAPVAAQRCSNCARRLAAARMRGKAKSGDGKPDPRTVYEPMWRIEHWEGGY